MGLRQLVPPDDQPLTAADLLVHLRELDDSQAGYLDDLIRVATTVFEDRTGRALLTQQWEATYDQFPACERILALPRPPLQTVDLVEYRDPAGEWQAWDEDNYTLDQSELFGRLQLAYGVSWPTTLAVPNAVRVTFTAGWDDPEAIPAPILQALRLLVGHWYEHREPVLTGTIQQELPFAATALMNGYVTAWV